MEKKEKKTSGQRLREEAMQYLFTCLSPDDGYSITDEGIMIFFYRYVVYKTLHFVEDLLIWFFWAVVIVLTTHLLLTVESNTGIIAFTIFGNFMLLCRLNRLKSLEYSLGVGRVVARLCEKFPEYYILEDSEEEDENGGTE